MKSKTKANATPRGNIFVLLSDPILERHYRNRFETLDFSAVWWEKKDSWEKAIRDNSYDVLVIDLTFFSDDPIENLKKIKELSPDSPIIVLSESQDVRLAISSFHVGIADYFLKPTNPETLAWSIEKVLRQRSLQSSHEVFSADLAVFRAAHQINISESDAKMRELAMRHLAEILEAKGVVWVWPETSEDSKRHAKIESYQLSEKAGNTLVKAFHKDYGELLENSFESQLTSHPDQWFREKWVWIPLRTSWMGGLLCSAPLKKTNSELQARVEFLVRNLEISLENYKRYVEAKQLTYIDDLTGLFNMRYLDFALTAAIEEHQRSGAGFCVLFVDIDHFKYVNDHYGHLVGSQLLIAVAKRIKHSLRNVDQTFRYGGDEFIALLHGHTAEEAVEIAHRIREQIENFRFKFKQIEIKVTVSIGVARFPDHSLEKKKIIEMADNAMYSGKKNGRNVVFLANS